MIGDTDDPPDADDHWPGPPGCLWALLLFLVILFLFLALFSRGDTT